MANRLKFVRGADEFVDRGVVFVKGGPGQEVDEDRYEFLKQLTGYDFEDETQEEYDERVAEAQKLEDEEAAAEEAAEPARQAELAAAQRTADFFNADSVAEQEAKGVTDDAASRPATESEDGDQQIPDPEYGDDAVEPTDDGSQESPSTKGTRSRRFE